MNEIIAAIADLSIAAITRLIGAILLLIIGLKVIKWIVKSIQKNSNYQKLDPLPRKALTIFIDYSLKVVLIVSLASLIGVPMASMIAVIGSIGLTVGLALQGSLSNIAGGIMIFVCKPFTIGDYITAGDQSGTVYDIGIFYTTLTTPDNKRITIANSVISNQTIVNYSVLDTRRVDNSFSVAYDSDIDKVRKILIDTALENASVLRDPAPVVFLKEDGDGFITFDLRVWCNNADYWSTYFAVKEAAKKALAKNGISVPSKQLDVHLEK